MKKHYVVLAMGFALFVTTICPAQDISQSVLIGRVKANRTHFQEWDHGASLKSRVAAKGADLNIRIVGYGNHGKCPQCPTVPPENNSRIRSATLDSDLVAIGTVTSNLSSLTANEAFIFTDSQFKVKEIWKGSVSPGVLDDGGTMDEVTVAAPGGVAKIGGHTVRATSSFRDQLQVGHTYILFLKYLPDSHSYQTVDGLIGFDLTGPAISCLYKGSIPPNADLISNRSEYLAAIQSSVQRQETEEQSQ